MQLSTPSELFLWFSCRKLSKDRFVDSSKVFPPCCTNNKSKMGFLKSIGLPGEAGASFSGYARLWIGVVTLSVWSNFFQLFLPFAIILLRLSSPVKLPQVRMSPQNP